MRKRLLGLTLGALTIASCSLARAEDVGCCLVECHTIDTAGAGVASVTRSDTTQADCVSRHSDCSTMWRPEACATEPGGSGSFHLRNPLLDEHFEAER
jgi:hypothetical protein